MNENKYEELTALSSAYQRLKSVNKETSNSQCLDVESKILDKINSLLDQFSK